MTKSNVRQFSDYRSFLLAHIQDSKRRNPRWTYGSFAKHVGLKDPSSILKIVRGQRDPGASITERLVRYFNFAAADADYFRDLVRLHKIKNDSQLTVALLEKMGKQHPNGALKILNDKDFQIISRWYCTAVREMVRLNTFFEDPNWISRSLRFKVTPTEASRAIELLLEGDLLRRDEQGRLVINHGRFHSTNDLASEGLKRYHEGMLANAAAALRSVAVDEREFTAVTLTMNLRRVAEAKVLIRDFRERFARLLEEDGGDVTAQFQMQFFPLTRGNPRAHRK